MDREMDRARADLNAAPAFVTGRKLAEAAGIEQGYRP
jgi:hypothetical protein